MSIPIEQLECKIREANNAYWNDNKPIISDIEYDTLIRELQASDPNNELLKHIGGTKGKYRHNPPMLSLNKAYTKDEVLRWAKSVARPNEQFLIQPKYDGLAGKIENKRLCTRGDGEFGEDVTHNSSFVSVLLVEDVGRKQVSRRYLFDKFVNLEYLFVDHKSILGEILISKQAFEDYFESGKILRVDGTKYSNSRNAVAGLINQKNIDIPNDVITFVPYNSYYCTANSVAELDAMFDDAVAFIKQQFGSKYPIDGIVFKLKDEQYAESLGNTAHHPRSAIAFKFSNEFDWGTIREVTWQSGKEVLTPVITLEEPIEINGSNISRATAHNYAQFIKFDFHKGDRVKIERAGDVIPKIVEVQHLNLGSKLEIPTVCPVCGSETIVQGTDILCTNQNCSGKIVPRMVAAAKILHVQGFGPVVCELLHTRLHINELWELLETNYCEMIGYLPGFTDYSADILYKNLKNVVSSEYDYEVFAALCIPGIGVEISKKIFEKFHINQLERVVETDPQALEELIGPTRTQWIIRAFKERKNSINKMFEYFNPVSKPIVTSGGKICMTGKFEHPKSYYKQLIESAGYQYTDVLTDDVLWLVCDDPMSTSSKMQKAAKKKIEVITSEVLLGRLS